MKKVLLYGMIVAGMILSSCVQGELGHDFDPLKKSLRLFVTVEEIGNLPAVKTRATVAPVDGETDVENLHLLFFEYSESGSGVFVGDYHVDAENAVTPGTGVPLEIGSGKGEDLSHSESYSIIAFANMNAYLGMSVEAFLASIEGKTEKQVMKTQLYLPGITAASPDGAAAEVIQRDALPMIGRTVKMADQELVQVGLTRAVARFDLQNTVREQYEVVSVAIYNAAKHSYFVLSPDGFATKHTAGNYYGDEEESVTIIPTNGTTLENGTAGNVTGGLYVFENFQGATTTTEGRLKTTALVVGLKNYGTGGTGIIPDDGETRYYRIPICPEGSGQNIMRNNVYKVSLKGVLAEGELNPDNAKEGQLEVTINNWSVDDEGLVVTDGQSTMAIPSKIIRFGRNDVPKEYDVFTLGPGTLEITQRTMPNGLHVALNGNKLTVSADILEGYDDRKGTFELGYGGLRGTLTVIQTPEDEQFLKLNRSTLPLFPVTAGSGIRAEDLSADLIQVSASGDWTVKLYNSAADNEGFRIRAEGSNTEYLTWNSAGNGQLPLDFVTTEVNPDADTRYSFAVFTLNDDPSYRQVLVLGQKAKTEIRTIPTVNQLGASEGVNGSMNFNTIGTPIGAGADAVNGNYHVLAVTAGSDWSWAITDGERTNFDVTRVDDNLMIRTTGMNVGGTSKKATLTLTRPGADDVCIDLVQRGFTLTISYANPAHTTVSVDGAHTPVLHKIYNPSDMSEDLASTSRYADADFTEYVELKVDIPDGVEWEAEITAYSHPGDANTPAHKGFLVVPDGSGGWKKATEVKGAGRGTDDYLRVSFDKVYFPLVHFTDAPNIPSVTVTFNIYGDPSLTAVQTVSQQPLEAKTPYGNILAYGGANYGSIASGGYYTRNYADAIVNAAYFGPSGVVRAPQAAVKTNHTTTMTVDQYGVASVPTIGYIHAGGTNDPGTYYNATFNGETYYGTRAIERWRNHYEGFVLYAFADSRPGYLTQPLSTLNIIGWRTEGSEIDPDTYSIQTESLDKRVMKYLLRGPFGETSTTNFTFPNATPADPTPLNAGEVATNTPNAVVAIKHNGTGNPMTVIDPANRVVFVSETETFMGNAATGTYNTYSDDVLIFQRNFGAIMMNGLMYGSHFYDPLCEDFKYPKWNVDVSNDATQPLWVLGGRNGNGAYPYVNLNAAP